MIIHACSIRQFYSKSRHHPGMLFLGFFAVFLLLSMPCFSAGASQGLKKEKSVLVLFSLVPSTPAYRIMLDGIRQKLTDAFGENYNLHIEYLQTEHYPNGNYPKERFDLYNQKYRNVSLDLLICVGPDIVSTIRQHADKQLLELPAVSLDYDFSAFSYKTEISLNAQTTAFPIKVDPLGTISAALALFPQTRSVFIISGISGMDKIFLSITQEAVKQMRGQKVFVYFSNISMDDVLKKVRHLPPNSIIVVPYFNVDSKMVPYYNPESVRLISNAANAPVFAYSDMGLGDGSVGGYLISFKKTGLMMGESAVSILKGANPGSISISKKDYYEYLFDWRELRRWNINSELIPSGSIILFEEITFFGKYKWALTGGIFFLLLQSFLIARLVFLHRRQRLTVIHLLETENKFRELVREDRILRIGQMTASLSHELNQPLTAILSTAQAGIRFIDSNKADPAMLKDIFQNIEEDEKRAAAILSGIRSMMKLEKREKEPVNMNSLIEETIKIYKTEAAAHQVRLNMKLCDTPVYVMADRIQIQQVIINFLSNATQAMEKITAADKNIFLAETMEGDSVIVSVRDFGTGMTEHVKAGLFKPFVTIRKEGLGVGLAISRTIIDDHRGKIWGESMPGGGSTFSFSLKILPDA
jgi:signal transduction histidine kinase